MAYYIRENESNKIVSGRFNLKASAIRALEGDQFSRSTHHAYNDRWRQREEARENLIDLVPFNLDPQPDHYLHISKNQDANSTKLLVAYTQDDTKGGQDIQTPIKVGAYLKKFYPDLTSDQITDLSGRLAAKYLLANGLKFAVTRAEIRDVYERCFQEDGVHSCMAGPVSRFSSRNVDYDVHPAEAYAGGDLQLAYLEKNGQIIARALCWPEKKVYGRVYGDSSRFWSMMDAQGYQEGDANDLIGARMAKIVIETDDYYGDRIVAPYIDGPNCVHESECGEYLIIGADPKDREHRYDAHLDGNFNMKMLTSHINRNLRGTRRTMVSVRDPIYDERRWIAKSEVEANTRDVDGVLYLTTNGYESYWAEVWDGDVSRLVPYTVRSNSYVQMPDGKFQHHTQVRHVDNVGYVTMRQFFTDYRTCEMVGRVYPITKMFRMEHDVWWSQNALDMYGVTIDGKHYAKWVAPVAQPDVAMAA